jgi:hypothetical protein
MIPTLTDVGAVDISVDLAMLFEGLYRRTVQPLRLPQPQQQGEDEDKDRAQALSQLLEKVHSSEMKCHIAPGNPYAPKRWSSRHSRTPLPRLSLQLSPALTADDRPVSLRTKLASTSWKWISGLASPTHSADRPFSPPSPIPFAVTHTALTNPRPSRTPSTTKRRPSLSAIEADVTGEFGAMPVDPPGTDTL